MNTEEKELKILMFKQATAFLEDAEEFFPYGAYVTVRGDLVPVGAYDGNEYSPSQEIIDILQKELSEKILKKEGVIAGIGIDVFINSENKSGEPIKKNALMIKTSTNGIDWKEDFYTYQIDNKKVTWD